MKKTVWITGASSGIGREFARRYAAMGCRLILTARRADRLTALAEELNDAHGTVCRILSADLADRADCDRLCAELAGERIDIFINNAGFGVCGSLLETDPAKEEEMVQVNVAAMRRLFQFMLRRMTIFLQSQSISSFPSDSSMPTSIMRPFPMEALQVPLMVTEACPARCITTLMLFLSF